MLGPLGASVGVFVRVGMVRTIAQRPRLIDRDRETGPDLTWQWTPDGSRRVRGARGRL
jgi:hypothetical protein